jgi:Sec-independent protein translocase protein TatA
MDGIFGVGLPEMLIIVLVIFVVGGPGNTAKWAREAGRTVRKLRKAWEEMMSDVEKELGPEGKELMDVSRELGRGAYEVRTMSSPARLMSETTRMVESSLADLDNDTPVRPEEPQAGAAQPQEEKYPAWLPQDKE